MAPKVGLRGGNREHVEDQLRQVIALQKEMLDNANRVIALQQSQMDMLIRKVRRRFDLDDEEASRA